MRSPDEHLVLLRLCADTCRATLFEHCLPEGGRYTQPTHVQRMMDCIEMCKTNIDFMTRGSKMHGLVCGACAELCLACAESCEAIKDAVMRHCAAVCRNCAAACAEMASEHHEHAA